MSTKTNVHLLAFYTYLLIALVKDLLLVNHFKFIDLLLICTIM